MEHPVSLTALYAAGVRATESERPDALFSDPLAGVLAGPEGAAIVASRDGDRSVSVTMPIRTRHFDDQVLRLLGSPLLSQLVLLAAGMDARAYRLGLADEVVCFEVDRSEVLDLKAHRIDAAGAMATCHRRTVPADLRGRWEEELVAAGFDPTHPAVFVTEGLLNYFDESAAAQLVDTIAGIAAEGSFLLADISGRSLLDSPSMAARMADLKKAGAPFRFGTDDPEGFLAAHGWEAEVTEYGEEGANFGRWLWPVPDRRDLSRPHTYLVTARRKTGRK
jgi:methyltransferase (TIGR00027 family)